jgi:hypothetical protein
MASPAESVWKARDAWRKIVASRSISNPADCAGISRRLTPTRCLTFLISVMTASLIGRLGSSAFRPSTTAVSMSLAGSRFSSESAHRPFHHGIRRRGGTIFTAALPMGRSKRTCELTSSIVPRGTSFHRLVELGFPPIALDPEWPHAAAASLVHLNSVPSVQMRCMVRARMREDEGCDAPSAMHAYFTIQIDWSRAAYSVHCGRSLKCKPFATSSVKTSDCTGNGVDQICSADRSKCGRIVNIASIAGREGNPNGSHYSASKAGLLALTKSLAKQLAAQPACW